MQIYMSPPQTLNPIVPLKYIQYGVYRDLIIIYSKPHSIYFKGTINPTPPGTPKRVHGTTNVWWDLSLRTLQRYSSKTQELTCI